MPRVALFITCLADDLLPRVGVAIVRVLEHYGFEVYFPDAQTCCGRPMHTEGYADQTATLAKRFLRVFDGFDYVVTPSAACCALVRNDYPALLPDNEAARRVAGRTLEFSEFVSRVLKVDWKNLSLAGPTRVAYQPTCYTRALGRDDTPAVLKRLGNVTAVPLEKSDQCCGFGGPFALRFPTISGALAEDKARAVATGSADVTICNEPGCALTLAGACHRAGARPEVKHLAEMMCEALRIDVETP